PTTATGLAAAGANYVFRGVDLAPDSTAPSISALSPADNSGNVAAGADLVATFSEPVQKGTGSITVKKSSDNSTIFSIDVNSSQVTVSGNTLTINPASDLEAGTDYYVQIPATAVRDIIGNSFAGISDTSTWNFSTASAADTTPPTILTLSPADNSTSAAVNADLVITFNENIVKGTGNILVRKTSDDSVVHTIDVTSAPVTVSGSTATINPSTDLQNLTGYYVQIPATAFRDASSNFFAGIADKTTWNFTTVADTTAPTVVSIDDGDADNSVVAGTLMTYTVTFSEDINDSTVSITDFDNAGTSAISFGSITETAPGVFSVQVTPTTGGTLILRIPASASISDVAGNALVGPVSDNDTITVSGDNTPPTLISFVDDRSGAAINANLPIIYTVTFDEDIDAASVTASDFTNAGTATIQVGTISEPSPGVFSVTVTPRSSGTLRLQIPTWAIITDVAGNQLVPPVLDDTTITVNSVTTLTAGDIAFTGIQSDDPDTFSFVLLKDVVNGTQIVFTDNLWNGTTLATSENTLTLTLNSTGSGFSAGTHFVNTNGGTAPAFRIIGTSTSAGIVAGTMSGLSTSGDSILAYQGSAPTSGSSSAWIAGINTKKWYDAATPDPTGSNESRLPTALTLGTHAIQLSSTTTEFDNGAFTPTSFTGTARAARIRVNTLSNWTTSDTVGPLSTTTFTIQPNQAPTDITLSGSTVDENQPVSTTLGTLAATDPNSDETLTFSLNSALVDNALFTVSGTTLLTATSFDFETRSSYQVTVRVTDVEGLTYDKTFNITVTDVNEAPSITSGTTWSVAEASTIGLQGSQSSAAPYLTSRNSDVQFTSLFTVGDSVGGYKMAGIPDGMGAWDNGDGTFTLLVNHEISNTLGVARAHGQKGAFVSRWVISKSTLQVISIQHFLPNTTSVYLSNNDQNAGTVHSAWLAANTTIFSRFCSADLAAPTAYRWTDPATSISYGTDARIFQTGEESGGSVTGVGPETTTLFGRQFAFVATDDSGTTLNEAGTAWELPHGGLFSWENNLANPTPQRKTIVIGLDDSSPGGQLYVWVGDKQTTGNVVERAGLTRVSAADSLYVVKVNGLAADATGATPELASTPINGTFSLVDEGDVSGLTVTGHDNRSNSLAGTKFLRPEDGSWDPANPADFYFVTTNQLDQVQDGIGSQIGRSRLYRLRFSDISNPVAGGTVTCLLDGTEGGNMLDNITVSGGKIILQEDVGNAAHLGKVWSYDIATDALTELAQHDRARFGDIGVAATAPFNVDEESSGVIDVSSILGAGTYLLNVQAHYTTTTELVEGGQLLLMKTNVASGQSLVGTQTATDPDAGTVCTWSISGGADQAKF
ncbi:MAG: Ig-like domain-containing protein, partial [Bacteroidota bacterium]